MYILHLSAFYAFSRLAAQGRYPLGISRSHWRARLLIALSSGILFVVPLLSLEIGSLYLHMESPHPFGIQRIPVNGENMLLFAAISGVLAFPLALIAPYLLVINKKWSIVVICSATIVASSIYILAF